MNGFTENEETPDRNQWIVMMFLAIAIPLVLVLGKNWPESQHFMVLSGMWYSVWALYIYTGFHLRNENLREHQCEVHSLVDYVWYVGMFCLLWHLAKLIWKDDIFEVITHQGGSLLVAQTVRSI